MASIGSNARTFSGGFAPDPTNNTPTAVRIPAGNGQDYGTFIGAAGDYAGTFQGNVENTTPSTFATGSVGSRSDLYELRPSSSGGTGTYLGYFELRPNGTAVFVRASSNTQPPPQPTVVAIGRTNNTSTIYFTTTNGASYNLRFTNSTGLQSPVSSWPAAPNVTTGDGTVKSVTDTTAEADRYYRIEAH